MDIYIYIDGSDLEEIADGISSSIESWLSESKAQAVLVNQISEPDETMCNKDLPDWELGINIKICKGKELKGPLNFLYGLAKEYKRDFVLGIFSSETQVTEDICFFGNEDGKPDVNEISSYIGINI